MCGNRYSASLVAVYVLLTAISELFCGLLSLTTTSGGNYFAAVVENFHILTVTGYLTVYYLNSISRLLSACLLFVGTQRRSRRFVGLFLVIFGVVLVVNFLQLSCLINSVFEREDRPLSVTGLQHQNAVSSLNETKSDKKDEKLELQQALGRGNGRVSAMMLSGMLLLDLVCLIIVTLFFRNLFKCTKNDDGSTNRGFRRASSSGTINDDGASHPLASDGQEELMCAISAHRQVSEPTFGLTASRQKSPKF